ncbi:MAG TPA: DnaJ domain-containing protein [Syntrophales bacterium]|nr:DnaJ domain-containing protein [Syntrophales bacterium]
MKEKNYYMILDIGPDEDDRGIRNAYRRLAKMYHPDLGGEESRARFEDIKEAYETLSDRDRRRAYDRRTRRAGIGTGVTWARPRVRPEPLLRPAAAAPAGRKNILFKEILSDLLYSCRAGEFDVEIAVTPEEAAAGSVWNLQVPAGPEPCPICGSSPFPCGYCRVAYGRFTTVRVALPPGLTRDSIFRLSLGKRAVRRPVRVYVRILD